MINISPGGMYGSIGRFWWANSVCQSCEVVGLTGLAHNPSRHLVWREGTCGWRSLTSATTRRLRWHVIRALN